MHDLNNYFYFVNVVEKQGFSSAARALNIPKSRLSRHIRDLEERLGIRLIQRTSRQFHITQAGRQFYHHARLMIDEMERAEASVQASQGLLAGRVALSCSVGVAQFAIKRLVTRFLALHPDIKLAQQVTNHSVDLIAQGIDLAVRGHNNPLPDSSLVQRHLAQVDWYLYAAPEYLTANGTPITPEDLCHHRALKVAWQPNTGQWTLESDQGLKAVVPYVPQLCSDDMSTLKDAAQSGLGIVALPAYTCREEIKAGLLQRVLPNWVASKAELSLVIPSRKGLAPPVRALADFLLAEVKNEVAV